MIPISNFEKYYVPLPDEIYKAAEVALKGERHESI